MLDMNAVALVFFGCINVASVKQLLPQSKVGGGAAGVLHCPDDVRAAEDSRLLSQKSKQYRKFSTKATRGMAEDHTSCCFHYYCSA